MSDRKLFNVPHSSRAVVLVQALAADCDLLSDYCDSILGRDYFFKRRHLLSILERKTNDVFAVTVDEQMGGLVIVYKSCVLDNLYLSPEFREGGIGSAVLNFLRPQRIRSKTNMLAGDPTPFYEKNGYKRDVPDPERPHIIDMVRDVAEPIAGNGTSRRSGQAERRESPIPDAGSFGKHLGSCLLLTPSAERVGSGPAPVQPHSPVTNGIVPLPPLAPTAAVNGSTVILPNGMVAMPSTEYAKMKTLLDTRERVRKYRARRKAEQAAIDAGKDGVTVGGGGGDESGAWLQQLCNQHSE